MIPWTVQWLDILHYKVQELSNYYDISSDLSMTYVNAGYNSISALASENVPDSIETFLVNNNNISNLMPYTFLEKTRLNQVDLTVNNLTNISKTSIQVGKIVGSLQMPFFSLAGNPLLCDCQMQWL